MADYDDIYKHWKKISTEINPDKKSESMVLNKVENKRPPLYEVILVNDDFTPMDFVVEVLMRFFKKDEKDAIKIMLTIHNNEQAVCGVYTRDIAETKVISVTEFARSNHHPLKCIMQKSENHVVKKPGA